MAEEECGCECNAAPTLIYACSGAADVGALADQAARRLTRAGVGSMHCLAGVGGRVQAILETTAQAGRILAIDGCPQDCARHTLEQAGFSASAHVRVTDLGLKKGSSPVTEETIARVAMQGQALLEQAKE